MVRQPLGVLGQPVGIEPLDRADDLPVKCSALLAKDAAVGDLVREGVLEGV
jgi:hypothetical protein